MRKWRHDFYQPSILNGLIITDEIKEGEQVTTQGNIEVPEADKNLEKIVKDEKTDEEKKEENPTDKLLPPEEKKEIAPTINNKEIIKTIPGLPPDTLIKKQPILIDNSLAQGDIYFVEENYEEALKCYNESLKIFEDVLLKKSIVLGRINNIAEALECLDILLKLCPEHQEALSQRKKILEILNPPDNGDKLSSELINKTYKKCLEVCPEIIDIQKTKEPNKEKELKSLIYMIVNNLSIREAKSELNVSFSSIQRCQDKLNKEKIIQKLIDNNILPKNEQKKPGKRKKV